MDVHSLLRQSGRALQTLCDKRKWTSVPLAVRSDKLKFVEHIISTAAHRSERCVRAGATGVLAYAKPLISPNSSAWSPTSRSSLMCAPLATFDNALLPYRWLPGLPTVQQSVFALSSSLHRGERIEVMHLADFWPGPVWLYASPGSGVWWGAGRHLVAVNLVDAILKLHPLSKVVDHLSAIRGGDRRYSAVIL